MFISSFECCWFPLYPSWNEKYMYTWKKKENDVKIFGFGSSWRVILSAVDWRVIIFAGLREKHDQDLENLTLATQPSKTMKLFVLAVLQYIKRSISYLLAKGGWLMLLSTVALAIGILLMTIDGPHEKVSYWIGFFFFL